MDLSALESRLGYRFKNVDLLERALTHRSWAHERFKESADKAAIRNSENESLEFVGDSVLGLAVAEDLFIRHPAASEGDLTLMKHGLVSMISLARAAQRLELGGALRMGRGEETTGGRSKPAILADALEAVLGAIFFDGGYTEASAAIGRIFAEDLRQATPEASLDYKSMLQEKLQAKRLSAPVYAITATEGQPHERTFHVEARWEGGLAEGSGRSIKAAEMMAARSALEQIDTAGSRG